MTDSSGLAEFRTRMESFRASREVEKQSHVAVMDLIAWYTQLSDRDRQLANQVVAEWVLSANETDRADARSMAVAFKVAEARSNLLELEGQLAAPNSPFYLDCDMGFRLPVVRAGRLLTRCLEGLFDRRPFLRDAKLVNPSKSSPFGKTRNTGRSCS